MVLSLRLRLNPGVRTKTDLIRYAYPNRSKESFSSYCPNSAFRVSDCRRLRILSFDLLSDERGKVETKAKAREPVVRAKGGAGGEELLKSKMRLSFRDRHHL